MLFPWFLPAIFALEVNQVVALRLSKFSTGAQDSGEEFRLMCAEKADASFEMFTGFMRGETFPTIMDRFCGHVTANLVRLQAK